MQLNLHSHQRQFVRQNLLLLTHGRVFSSLDTQIMRVTHFRNQSDLLTLKSRIGEDASQLTIHYPCKFNKDAFHTYFSPNSCLISW